MNKQVRNSIIKWANKLTDEKLEKLYYDTVYLSVSSIAELIIVHGYSFIDAKEQEKFERFQEEKIDLLEELCKERGIALWQNKNNHSA